MLWGEWVMLIVERSSFYHPSAYAIALLVVDLPLCFVQVFIWNIVVYFMSGMFLLVLT